MTWQVAISLYLVLATAAYLLRRSLAQTLSGQNRLINGFFFLCILYPLGLLVAVFTSPDLNVGWLNIFFAFAGSGMFPLVMVTAFRANKDIDAGVYTIINNITPIVTILAATILLNENLTTQQAAAAAIIISSAFLATLPNLKHRKIKAPAGVVYALASVVILGFAIVFERWMLSRMDYGAYLVYGWGAQAFWMTVLAWRERAHVKLLWKRDNFRKVLAYGLTNALKGLAFVGALKLSGSASLVSAFSSFLAVLVVLSAYFVLKEKDHLWLKVGSAFIGAAGLIILNTG